MPCLRRDLLIRRPLGAGTHDAAVAPSQRRTTVSVAPWEQASTIEGDGPAALNCTSRRPEIRRWRPSRPESVRNSGSSGPKDPFSHWLA
jgi:hypothetical protein